MISHLLHKHLTKLTLIPAIIKRNFLNFCTISTVTPLLFFLAGAVAIKLCASTITSVLIFQQQLQKKILRIASPAFLLFWWEGKEKCPSHQKRSHTQKKTAPISFLKHCSGVARLPSVLQKWAQEVGQKCVCVGKEFVVAIRKTISQTVTVWLTHPNILSTSFIILPAVFLLVIHIRITNSSCHFTSLCSTSFSPSSSNQKDDRDALLANSHYPVVKFWRFSTEWWGRRWPGNRFGGLGLGEKGVEGALYGGT